MGHLNQVHAGAWLPWLALTYVALARKLSANGGAERRAIAAAATPYVVSGGAVVALLLTAGHTQEAYFSLLAVGLLGAGFTALPPAWAPRRWPHLVALGALTLNGALLAAAQLLPTLELMGHSYRQGGVPLEEATGFGVERTYLLESLLPTFWHLPGQEVTGYVGTVALALALGALASPARRTAVSLLALALFAVTLTLGTYTPLFALLHRWLPFFDAFRAPGRWLLISSFALAGLAAHGLHALRWHASAHVRERVTRVYALAVAVVAGGALLFAWRSESVHAIHWLPHARVAVLWLGAALGTAALAVAGSTVRASWPAAVLVAGLALELTYAAREMEYNQPGPPALYSEAPQVGTYLDRQAGQGAPPPRTLSLAAEERLDGERLRRSVPTEDGEARRYGAMKEALRPNLGIVFGLPSPDGYDGGLLPLRSYAELKALLVTDEAPVPHFTLAPQAPAHPSARLLSAFNVRFLLSDGRQGAPGAGWTAHEVAPGAAWLYENEAVLPRAFVVSDVRAEPDPRRALALLRGLDLTASAVIERPVAGLASGAARGAAPAEISHYSSTDLTVEATGPGLLVLSESYYPGWRATVDGVDAPLVRANLHFRGVPLSGGPHRVRVWYDPLSVKLGFAATALALLGNVVALAMARRAR
jgi:hypothetical protein